MQQTQNSIYKSVNYLFTFPFPMKLHGAESFLRSKNFSVSQEIPHILWSPKFQYRVHNSRPFFLYFRKSVGYEIQSRLNRQLRLVLESYVYYMNCKRLWNMFPPEEEVVFQYFNFDKEKMSALPT